jgi:hypothetical protein
VIAFVRTVSIATVAGAPRLGIGAGSAGRKESALAVVVSRLNSGKRGGNALTLPG